MTRTHETARPSREQRMTPVQRAEAWYAAAYRRLEASENPATVRGLAARFMDGSIWDAPIVSNLLGEQADRRAAIGNRYARLASAPGTLAGLARADAASAALRRNFG